MPELRYIPVAVYTIGCCRYGSDTPFKTVEIKADSLDQAMRAGREQLKPSTVQRVVHVDTQPNPDHVATLQEAGLLLAKNLRKNPGKDIE